MQVDVTEGPTVVGETVVLSVAITRGQTRMVFVVTVSAPGLFSFSPYVYEVRKVIADVLVKHEDEITSMFEAMGKPCP